MHTLVPLSLWMVGNISERCERLMSRLISGRAASWNERNGIPSSPDQFILCDREVISAGIAILGKWLFAYIWKPTSHSVTLTAGVLKRCL